ncbi:chorismate mutase [Pseudomonas aeruginosa]|uniref:chorismate mutase n=1 Tax=Pseudomonas aeruginosa TaxID=287 RepID=UPI001F41DE3F|nr:chorismate mutase [Pseudomonas aeruginosa]UGX00650.1 chorismate mutase [Pseudomonas aeruginosa]
MRPSFASWGLLALLLLQGPLLQAQPLSPALQQLLSLSSQRLQLADQVAQSKARSGKAVQDSPREKQQLQMLAGQAGSHGVGAEQVRLLFAAQIEANKLVQYRLLSRPLPDAGQAVDLERIRNRLSQLNLELLRGYAPALAELRGDDCRPRLNQALQRQVRDDRLDELHAIALSRAAGDLCHWAAL